MPLAETAPFLPFSFSLSISFSLPTKFGVNVFDLADLLPTRRPMKNFTAPKFHRQPTKPPPYLVFAHIFSPPHIHRRLWQKRDIDDAVLPLVKQRHRQRNDLVRLMSHFFLPSNSQHVTRHLHFSRWFFDRTEANTYPIEFTQPFHYVYSFVLLTLLLIIIIIIIIITELKFSCLFPYKNVKEVHRCLCSLLILQREPYEIFIFFAFIA